MADPTKASERASYADLFEKTLDPVFLLDLDSFKVIDANIACERMFGLSLTEINGKEVTEWIGAEEKEQFNQMLRVVRRRYYPRSHRCVWKLAEGKEMHVELSACTLKLTATEQVMQVIAKDMTPIFEAEKKAADYLLELQAANLRLAEISIRDEMTQLFNFRHFKLELAKEHERAWRYQGIYSILFCDVDHFKHYNDRNGHPAGDEVLRKVGEIILKSARNTDLVARYGGEEFVVLCPEVGCDNAKFLAERIRTNIEKYAFAFAEFQPLKAVTLSIGIASYPDAGDKSEIVLKAADEAVYTSKREGRNRVSICNKITISEDVT